MDMCNYSLEMIWSRQAFSCQHYEGRINSLQEKKGCELTTPKAELL
jgi:hypothetical protein